MILHSDVCQKDIVDNLTVLMCLTMHGKLQNQFTEELMTATNYYYVYIHLWIQCCNMVEELRKTLYDII
jgi:hypothetical protein